MTKAGTCLIRVFRGITASSKKAIIEIDIIIVLFYLSFKTVISHFCAIHLCISGKMDAGVTFGHRVWWRYVLSSAYVFHFVSHILLFGR